MSGSEYEWLQRNVREGFRDIQKCPESAQKVKDQKYAVPSI
jgi:hypothetical protein